MKRRNFIRTVGLGIGGILFGASLILGEPKYTLADCLRDKELQPILDHLAGKNPPDPNWLTNMHIHKGNSQVNKWSWGCIEYSCRTKHK